MVDTTALQRYSLFGGVLPEDIERMLPLFGSARYAEGEDLQSEGQPNDRIYFILEGRVAILKGGRLLAELGEGQTCGEMEFLDIMPSAATVRALAPVRVATISNHALHEISKLCPPSFSLMIMNLARDLSRRLRRMDELMAEGAGPACP